MSKDYYAVLGVDKKASKEDIKRAFRKKAHEHHPDKKSGDEVKFKEINEAYQVLSDETKRSQYDQFGQTFDNANAGGNGATGGFGGFSGAQGMNFEDLGDIFSGMFGGGFSGGTKQSRGNDIMTDVRISFKESVFGVEKEITLSKNDTCERCAGTGGEPGTNLKTCSDCSGSGVKIGMRQTMFGTVQTKISCPTCEGRGENPEKECSTCKGSGVEYKKKTLRIDIPAGVENGMRIRVRGQGESIGHLGQPGDLYLNISVDNDLRFQRQGFDILTEKKIGFTQAGLGDNVQVDTVDGKVKLKIPVGTQSGDKLRLRGKGVKHGRSRGDQIVIINVVTPKRLNRSQKKLLEELDLKEK